ncbi:uncharacterized protein J4E79_004390 [Alternaria viburni]|uniref:uncharacterized protein n=1 Tax=Alternaria viburni TaxID=566460 RepID=UPI0020C4C57C|nr:uncharacterized protein J4E79_004390 [Alternaria viburni]KAI4663076.1 hypothetical protein J4E79_004390 [Alternaria viburni]
MPVDEWTPSKITYDPPEKGRLGYSDPVEYHDVTEQQQPHVPAKRARPTEQEFSVRKKRFFDDIRPLPTSPNQHKSKNNSRKASSSNSKSRSASTTKQRVHVDLTQDVDMESVDGRVPESIDGGVPESVDGGVALSNVSVNGGVSIPPSEAAMDISSPVSSRAAMQFRAEHTELPETPLQSRQDKGKGKATEMAPPPRLPTPDSEETHSPPHQPTESEVGRIVYAYLRELGLDLINPQKSLAKAFDALRKEMDEPLDLKKWCLPARFDKEGTEVPFSGKPFFQVPLNIVNELSDAIAQGNFLDGEWAPLWDAFEEFYPDKLPGARMRAEREAASQSASQQVPPPTQPRAMRDSANHGAGPSQQPTPSTRPKAKKRARTARQSPEPEELPYGPWLTRWAMSLGPEDFTFPGDCPWAYKKVVNLTHEERVDIAMKYHSKELTDIIGRRQFNWCKAALRYHGLIR